MSGAAPNRLGRRIRAAGLASALCAGVVVSAPGLHGVSSAQVQPETDPEVAEILETLRKTYAALSAYSDRGVAFASHPGAPQRDRTQRFSTQFERSRRFGWASDLGTGDDYRIVAEGGAVLQLWNGRREPIPDLRLAVAGAAGISDFASVWIPTLLMPEMFQREGVIARLRYPALWTRLPDAEAGGQSCFVLRSLDGGIEVRVWTSTRDFLIRRIEDRLIPLNVIVTTDYSPRTDIALTP